MVDHVESLHKSTFICNIGLLMKSQFDFHINKYDVECAAISSSNNHFLHQFFHQTTITKKRIDRDYLNMINHIIQDGMDKISMNQA